jgi:uncharacterized membrane protein
VATCGCCRGMATLNKAGAAAKQYLHKFTDRSDPDVRALHTLIWNVGLFAVAAIFIQKYGYKLAV